MLMERPSRQFALRYANFPTMRRRFASETIRAIDILPREDARGRRRRDRARARRKVDFHETEFVARARVARARRETGTRKNKIIADAPRDDGAVRWDPDPLIR